MVLYNCFLALSVHCLAHFQMNTFSPRFETKKKCLGSIHKKFLNRAFFIRMAMMNFPKNVLAGHQVMACHDVLFSFWEQK